MEKEFTKYEYDNLTLCADNPMLYSVNINPNTNDVSIFSKKDNRSMWKLGKSNDLVIKLLKCLQVVLHIMLYNAQYHINNILTLNDGIDVKGE